MLELIGCAVLVLAATVDPSAATLDETVHAAVTTPVVAVAPKRRHRHQSAAVVRPQSEDEQEIQRQIERRVLMPALSGDGGG
jgi:hypothetical protein